jgi:hypothetical protein
VKFVRNWGQTVSDRLNNFLTGFSRFLIIQTIYSAAGFSHGSSVGSELLSALRNLPKCMNDLIYVGIVVAFFAGSVLYVRFCEKL